MKVRLRIFIVLMLACALGGCGIRHQTTVSRTPEATQRTPTEQNAKPVATQAQGKRYTVVSGDTMYSIAHRHNVDFRDLARWNDLAAPYTIYPGQSLRVDGIEAPKPVVSAPAQPLSQSAKPEPVKPVAPVAPAPAPASPPVAVEIERPTAPKPAASQPTPSTPPVSTTPPPVASPKTTVTAPPTIAAAGSRAVDGIAWRWPTNGHVVATYAAGDQTRQGLGIAGNAGQPVLASADGEVVYSGAGLLGYGELVIIKHSDTYLSAYGHNRKRLVAEGEKVRSGQQIAEMGRSGAARDMLHFEIRKNGKPVDPVGFLPKR